MSKKTSRSPGMTTITFSCTEDLKSRIQAAADSQKRNVSNWIANELEKFLNGISSSPPSTPETALAEDVAAFVAARLREMSPRSGEPSAENPTPASTAPPKKRSQ